jgi:hydroxymethylglutaryl-CoA lyase
MPASDVPEPDVIVREVGLRDGLQNVATFYPTDSKLAWVTAEYEAGVREMQVCSFVPEKVFPQFRDCAEVVSHALRHADLIVSAFVPNVKGAQRAFQARVHLLGHVVSASEGHNRRNLQRSAADSMEDFRAIADLRQSRDEWRGARLGGYVATAFGCAIEGRIDPDRVIRLADQYVELGADEVIIADTVGFADPAHVKAIFSRLNSRLSNVSLSAHFHDTRGLGLANVVAALDAGVRRFDSSLAGLGGCPAAPGATGNIVTEDLVFMLESMSLSTGIDIERLVEMRGIVERELPDEALRSAIAAAGLPKGFTAAKSLD